MPSQGDDPIERVRTSLETVDWQRSALYGGGAWLVALVLSYVIVTVTGPGVDGRTLEVAAIGHFEGMGGHYDVSAGSWGLHGIYSQMDSKFWGLAVFLHYLVPAAAVVVVSYLVASGARGEQPDPDAGFDARFDAWIAGVSAALVFGALTVFTAYGLSPDGADPDFFRLVVAAGVFPIAFGAIGAARAAGFGIVSARATGAGAGSVVLALLLWRFVEEPFGGSVSFGDLSGADQWLPYLGYFLADHGVFMTPGQLDFLTGGSTLMGAGDAGLIGSTGPVLVVLLAPLAVAAALVYRDDVLDPVVAAGRGARVAVGYFLVTTVLTLAVLGQRMNNRYDELYGTGSEEQVREQLFHIANEMFGAVLPQALLVAGVLFPVLVGAVGGISGAVVGQQVADDADQSAATSDEQMAEATGESGAPEAAE